METGPVYAPLLVSQLRFRLRDADHPPPVDLPFPGLPVDFLVPESYSN